jgi:hypothetical protein
MMSAMTLPANLDQLTADELRELVRQQAAAITHKDRELNWRGVNGVRPLFRVADQDGVGVVSGFWWVNTDPSNNSLMCVKMLNAWTIQPERADMAVQAPPKTGFELWQDGINKAVGDAKWNFWDCAQSIR